MKAPVRAFPFKFILCLLTGGFLTFAPTAPAISQPLFVNIGKEKGLSSLHINDLYQDAHGFVWIGTSHGLYRFDGYGCTRYEHNPADPASISSSQIGMQSLAEDADHNLWVATSRGGLNRFVRHSEQFDRYRADKNGISMDKIMAVEPDGKGGLWVATAGRGFNHVDPRTQTIRKWDADADHPALLMGSTVTASLKQERNGRLWIGTNKGACRFDPAGNSFEYFPFAVQSDKGPSDPFITVIQEDPAGTVWLGTVKGLNRWDPLRRIFVPIFFSSFFSEYNKQFDYIMDIQPDASGLIWVATRGGLIRYDPRSGGVERFVHRPDDPFSILPGPVNTLMLDRSGNLWCGATSGISILNQSGARFGLERLLPVQDLARHATQTEGFNAVLEVGGTLWLATQKGLHLLESGGAPRALA